MPKKALFAISSLGLGHATRTLPVIKTYLQKGYKIDIISYGNTLCYLENELTSKQVTFLEYQDYPLLERGNGIAFYYYLIIDTITTSFRVRREHKFTEKLVEKNKYDFIFSDGKYGFYSKKIPSFILSHQISFDMPKYFRVFQGLSDWYNKKIFTKFTTLFIPDYEDKDINLGGRLSHPEWVKIISHNYIGILSSFYDVHTKDIIKSDYFFTISGYLKEGKEGFIKKLKKEAEQLHGKKVFMLGDSSKNEVIHDKKNDITLYSFLVGEQKNSFYLGADIIISRAGYTTIMDLVELDKKAILYPTPHQTEQEYLTKYLEKKGLFTTGNEQSLLSECIEKSKTQKKQIFPTKTKEALNIITKKIDTLC